MDDRTAGTEDKGDVTEKSDKDKQKYEQNVQELWYLTKRQNHTKIPPHPC
jgi:hypothetical protein